MSINPELKRPNKTLDESRRRLIDLLVAARREEAREASTVMMPRSRSETSWPLSFAQERLWFLEQVQGPKGAYTLPTALRLLGPLHVPALQQALDAIVMRHEVLRVRFEMHGGQPLQVINPPSPVEVQIEDVSSVDAGERERRVRMLMHEKAMENALWRQLYRFATTRPSDWQRPRTGLPGPSVVRRGFLDRNA
jgi:hypothetical protein